MLLQGPSSLFQGGNCPIDCHMKNKMEKGLSIIAGCTVYSSCLVCELLCNHGFRVISSRIDAFARSSTSGSLCCRVTCLCISISADMAGQRRWISVFHEHSWYKEAQTYFQFLAVVVCVQSTFLFYFFFLKESSCSHCSHFSIRSYGDATLCVGDAHRE